MSFVSTFLVDEITLRNSELRIWDLEVRIDAKKTQSRQNPVAIAVVNISCPKILKRDR